MNKRVVAVVLAGAMAASQLAGPVEVIAAQTSGEVESTASETSEKVVEEGAGVDTPVEAAKDNSVQTQAVVKGILTQAGDLFIRDDSTGLATTTPTTADDVTDLVIGSGLVSIPNNKFQNKTQLTKLSFMSHDQASNLTTSIGDGAFQGTGLTEVILPKAMGTIGASAFADIPTLTTVDFSVSTVVTTLGENAFKGTGLTSVTLPAGLTSMGKGAFQGNTALTNVDLSTAVGNTAIAESAFQGNTKLTAITIPAAVTSIGASAFAGTGLTTVVIPAGVTSIGASAFKGITALKTADFTGATALTGIGANAFESTGLTVAVIPAAVTTIGNAAFANNADLETVTLTGATELLTIGENAFKSTGVTDVAFPAKLTTIGNSAFANNVDLETATFTGTAALTSIGESAFEGSGLTGALDLSGITLAVDVKEKAFKNNAALSTVVLPAEMTTLKTEVFIGTALKTIEINEKCTAVEASALPVTLEIITVKAGNAALAAEDGVLYNQTKVNLKLVPMAKTGELTVPATVITIDANAAKGNTNLTAVKLAGVPELKDIEANAFEGTTALKLLDLRKATKIEKVKAAAFKDSALESMYLDATTKDFTASAGIGADAFASTVKTRVAKFFKADGSEQEPGNDLIALETKWTALKTPANGGWTFYVKPTKPAKPNATANYTDMKLEGLTLSTDYNIVVDGGTEVLTADVDGKIAIKKEWGGKTISITTKPTLIHLESDPQELTIEGIYTVTVGGIVEKASIAGQKVTFNAAAQAGQTFIKWLAEGVEISDPIQATIEFTMPANDVTLTKVYKTTNTTTPNAATDYAEMKLTGLSPDAVYTIENEEMTADSTGKVAIKKEWGGNSISIVKNETETETESPTQTLQINAIYSITVGETEVAISVKDEAVTIKAPALEGHLFKEWTDGFDALTVTAGGKTTETITFTMLDKDVILKAEYTKIVITKPEDMEYDGEKEVKVELDVPFDEFQDLVVNGETLVKDKDYTVSKGPVTTLATEKTVITFTKEYLDKLTVGESTTITAVLKSGNVNFSINVVEKPTVPEKPPVVFPDVDKNEWYAQAIDHVSSKEYMTGFADGKFGPADTLGRGQFASILHRMAGSPVAEYQGIFTDVPNGTFYTMPVIWAHKNQVITGYQNGSFGPSDSMTREQLVTMLYRYTQIKGGNTVARASIESFPDNAKVSGFAVEAMKWGVAEGLVSGDNGALNPQGIASRAVGATLIQRFEMKQKPEVTPPTPDTTPPTTP